MYCGQFTIVKTDGKTFSAHPLRCKCWTCANCQPMRKARLIKEGKAGKPHLFITLTSNPHTYDSPEQRAQKLVEAWRQVVRKLRRLPRYQRLQYFVVIEKTQKGEPHLHIMARAPFIEQRWLSDQMRDLIGAPIVDIKAIKSDRAAAQYVAKYLGKDPKTFDGCKRYWRSLDYMHPTRAELRAARDPETSFHLIPMSFAEYRKAVRLHDVIVKQEFSTAFNGTLAPWMEAPPLCTRMQPP